jgi:hypothetical protein
VEKTTQSEPSSPNIIRVRWTRHIINVGEMRIAHNILQKNLKGKDYLEDLAIDGG